MTPKIFQGRSTSGRASGVAALCVKVLAGDPHRRLDFADEEGRGRRASGPSRNAEQSAEFSSYSRQEGVMIRRVMLLCLVFVGSVLSVEAADATGRWQVTIAAKGSTLVGIALLKQTGEEITGSMGVDEQNQHPLDGIVKGNRITLTMHPRPGRTTAFAKCELTLEGDKMTGITEGGDLGGKANIELVRDKK
jgi:hypothetical protein